MADEYGITIWNEDGGVILSDKIQSYNFLTKATYVSSTGFVEGDFNSYSGSRDDWLDGHTMYTFKAYTKYVPMVFIHPSDQSLLHSIIYQSYNNGLWIFKVMVVGSGSQNARPNLLLFVGSNQMTRQNDEYGLVVYTEDGKTVTFDSRLRPLVIQHNLSVISPEVPMNSGLPTNGYYSSGYGGMIHTGEECKSWNYKTLDWDFGSDGVSNKYGVYANIDADNVMFAVPCLGQAVYSRAICGYKKSSGYDSDQEHWSTARWWVMYRQAFKYYRGIFYSGWGNIASGYFFSSKAEDGGIGGGSGGSWQSGSQPYADKTINLKETNAIIADASWFE